MGQQTTTTLRPLLVAAGVRKSFGRTHALAGLDFTLMAGEIHALLGSNGAGKSTFIKVLAGVCDLNEGRIDVMGEPLGSETSSAFAFIHQDLGLISMLTVAENFGLVAGFEGRWGIVRERALRRAARESVERLGLDVAADVLVADLSPGDRTLVAIARALHTQARIIVLDEPTASLPAADVERLYRVLRALREEGASVIYVTHRLPEVFELCDRVSVLRDGACQATLRLGDVSEVQLVELILGEQLAATERSITRVATDAVSSSPERIRFLDIHSAGLHGVSLAVRAGEVVGCTGLRGAGQQELARCLLGLSHYRGAIRIGDALLRAKSPAAAMRRGVGYLTGDRAQTVAQGLSVTENLFLNPCFTRYPKWLRSPRRERRHAREMAQTYDVRPASPDGAIESLSGGNAQKVVLARCEQSAPDIIVLDDPTAGLDVGARADFYALVRRRCVQGKAVLLISSDYEEVAALSDRVLVFDQGRVVAELTGGQLTADRVSSVAMGATS